MKQYDAIIIGFGRAGKMLAAELANRGWQVVIIERSDKMYGGACPNIGKTPECDDLHRSGVFHFSQCDKGESPRRGYRAARERDFHQYRLHSHHSSN